MTSERGPAREDLTEDELAGFTEKLQSWGKTLSTKEQGLLLEILGRAAAVGDVAWYTRSDTYLKFGVAAANDDAGAAYFKFFHSGQSGLLLPAVRQVALG